MKIRKGDRVVVLTGKDKGSEGIVMEVRPKDNKVVVDGVNVAQRHTTPNRTNQQGGINNKNMPLDASNVMYLHKGKATRLGYRIEADGTKVRIAKSTGEVIK